MFSLYDERHASPFHGERGAGFADPCPPPSLQPSPTSPTEKAAATQEHLLRTGVPSRGPAQQQLAEWPPSIYVPADFGWPRVLGHGHRALPPSLGHSPVGFKKVLRGKPHY